MPEYSHPCSPKKFTQHQLFACLVLKEFFKLDYRGVEALLVDSDSLRAIIDLRVAPDFTTLHKACRRLLRLPVCNQLLDETIAVAKRTPLLQSPVKVAAIDSSGFESRIEPATSSSAAAHPTENIRGNGRKRPIAAFRSWASCAIAARI